MDSSTNFNIFTQQLETIVEHFSQHQGNTFKLFLIFKQIF